MIPSGDQNISAHQIVRHSSDGPLPRSFCTRHCTCEDLGSALVRLAPPYAAHAPSVLGRKPCKGQLLSSRNKHFFFFASPGYSILSYASTTKMYCFFQGEMLLKIYLLNRKTK